MFLRAKAATAFSSS